MSERTKILTDEDLKMLRMIAETHHRVDFASWKVISMIDELRAARVVVEAAKAWRGSQVNVSSNPNRPYYVDADDGNAEQGLMREPVRNALVRAIDALAGAK